MKFFTPKQTEDCQVHGGHARKANKALIFMVLASMSLVVWHVWIYGPSGHAPKADLAKDSFLMLLGEEIWDLLFNKKGIATELWEVFPYFIAGVLLAGYLRTYKIAVKLQASLRKYGIAAVFLASFVGIITPLCACGTVTTAISLLFAGLPLAPVMSLMVTSPLLSPSTYLITLNDLGPEWTVIRTIAAYSMGIFAGLVTHALRNKGFQTKTLFIEGAVIRGDFHDEDYPDERFKCNCRQKFGNRVALKTDSKFLIFLAKSSEMLWMVGKYIIVGVAIGAVVERYMPEDLIYRFFGRKDPLNIVWVTLCSVPMFLHQVSASSILSHIKGSLSGTLDGGTALAFMVGGPVTAIPTMVLFWTIFKKRVFVLYMFVCLAGTLIIAYTFQSLVFVSGVDTGNELLRGVNSISGGKSLQLVKKDKNVRMVIDPGGKGLIATYLNDLEGKGGVVFDSGYDRLLGAVAAKYGNRRYAVNVAKWLEQNGSSQMKSNILIYTLSSADSPQISESTLAALKDNGFRVKTVTKIKGQELPENTLAEVGQLWLIAGDHGVLSDKELKAISEFSSKGNGLLIVDGGADISNAGSLESINKLSSLYGVMFTELVDNRDELKVGVASGMFGKASEMLGKMLKLVHKG